MTDEGLPSDEMIGEQMPAQWRPDPYGRAQQRWWDGDRWTERVATGGEESTDPLGATATIPFAAPFNPSAPAERSRLRRIITSLGPKRIAAVTLAAAAIVVALVLTLT
ncbi:MAG TPA: DUF2510 domain-containing protein [Ilumatobacteraceae bacterium]|nr:DUF2510 domain-containing protein [Ilumatobacteraceae bacterium]